MSPRLQSNLGKAWWVLGAAALASLALAACSAPPSLMTPEHRDALGDSVRVALSDFEARSGAGPAVGIADFYSHDPAFRMYENGRLAYSSADEVRAALEQFGPEARVRTEFHDPQVLPVGPGQALVHSGFSSTVEAGQGEFSFSGVMTLQWVHESDGWRIRTGHTSSPPPPNDDESGAAVPEGESRAGM